MSVVDDPILVRRVYDSIRRVCGFECRLQSIIIGKLLIVSSLVVKRDVRARISEGCANRTRQIQQNYISKHFLYILMIIFMTTVYKVYYKSIHFLAVFYALNTLFFEPKGIIFSEAILKNFSKSIKGLSDKI